MKNVPRYTSYPTAPNFHDGVAESDYIHWLKSLDEKQDLSLYFHIPYCHKLCWFCGCHTKIVNQYSPVAQYLPILEQEVKLLSSYISPLSVKHIHFGGGSPTIIKGDEFLKFMTLVGEHFNIDATADIAIEMDPRTIDDEKIKAYKAARVTRASLGVQDFDLKVQEMVNRVQPYELVKDVLDALRAGGMNAINIDLIYGLPMQTLKTVEKTIAQTISLQPNRISLFGYAHVPWMKKHQNLVDESMLPSPEDRSIIAARARQLLTDAGYIPIGIDHFAHPDDDMATAKHKGQLQRNFQGYTTDTAAAILGMGVSSISALPHGYVQNSPDNITYGRLLKQGKLPISRGIALSEDDRRRRAIIMDLMCHFQAEFNADEYGRELEMLRPYFTSGEAVYENNILKIDARHYQKMRLIASVFDRYLSEEKHRYSQAV